MARGGVVRGRETGRDNWAGAGHLPQEFFTAAKTELSTSQPKSLQSCRSSPQLFTLIHTHTHCQPKLGSAKGFFSHTISALPGL